MPIHEILICLLVGYAFGNIPNGYLYAKAHGIDIYKEGSGNPGTTNVLRTLGKKAGITVLLMDIAKCMLPIFFMVLYFKPENEDIKSLILMTTGIGAILGHNFPLYSQGKGWKRSGLYRSSFDCSIPSLYSLPITLFYTGCPDYRLCKLGINAGCYGFLSLCCIFRKNFSTVPVFGSGLSSHVCFKFSSYGNAYFSA